MLYSTLNRLLSLVAATMLFSLPLRAMTIHVSPDGPVTSMAEARDAVRQLKADGPLTETVFVEFADGVYRLKEPVVFTPEDSGTAQHPVVYRAAPGARPVFSGGRAINGFSEKEDGMWSVELPWAAGATTPDDACNRPSPDPVHDPVQRFEQLWVNGRRAMRARSPNESYFYMEDGVQEMMNPMTGRKEHLGRRAFFARAKDIRPLLDLPSQHVTDVVMTWYFSWDATLNRLGYVDPGSNVVFNTGEPRYLFWQTGRHRRYHIENLRSALDAPGEWFLDRAGELLYVPRERERIADVHVVAPILDHLLVLSGDYAAGRYVEHVQFRGLTFRHTRFRLPYGGHADSQASHFTKAAIMVNGARHILFADCEVSRTATWGVWFHRACSDCRIERTLLHDLGAGGIRIGTGNSWSEEWGVHEMDSTTHTHHVSLENNIIHDGGHLMPGGVGVWIGHSSDNRVTHNDIAGFRYSGVSVGWRWGFDGGVGHRSPAKRNLVAYNRIHDIGLGVLGDMGGVYTLGDLTGTLIANNVIHDVWSDNAGYFNTGWGIYPDEGSSHLVIENNLVYDTSSGAFLEHNGSDNIVRNNIFAFSKDSRWQMWRAQGVELRDRPLTFERNIFYWRNLERGRPDRPAVGRLISGEVWTQGPNIVMDFNCYWNTDAGRDTEIYEGLDLAGWRKRTGKDANSIVVDPMFVDADGRDFRLSPESPVFALGFEAFDYASAGVYGREEWRKRARVKSWPAVEFDPNDPRVQ